MTSNEVVKSVAKKLKYYFEVKRLEDGFDLSDVHQPQLDHPPLKARPALQYDGLHDRALKHYFSEPEIKVQLTQMNGSNGKGGCFGKKEVQVRRMLDSYMKHYNFQAELFASAPRKTSEMSKRNTLPSCYTLYCSKGCPQKLEPKLNRSKKSRNLIGGLPVLRSVPDQHISKGEAARLVNSATKILVAADLIGNTSDKDNKKKKQTAPRQFESMVTFPSLKGDRHPSYRSASNKRKTRRPATAKFSWDSQPKRAPSPKRKAYDDSYIGRRSKTPEPPKLRTPRPRSPPRARSPTPSQSTMTTTTTETTTETTASTITKDDYKAAPTSRPRSAKYRSRTIINVSEPRQQEEVAVIRATQTVADFDVGSQTDRQALDRYDQLEREVTDGPWCEYQIYVCTGDRIGASTKAAVKFTIYGDKGRTKEFTLSDSKRHKIPFQKGKEDLFMLAAHHVGRMRKIKIGHDRPELSYAWFCEGVTVYDMNERRIFQFPCERWLSGQDGDKRTYRILQVDRERAFLDELNEEKKPPKHTYASESENSSTLNEELRYKVKGHKAYSTRVRRGDVSSDSDDSDTSSESSSGSSSSASSKGAKIAVKDDGISPREKKKTPRKTAVKDDYEEKAKAGTVITLHTGEDSKQVDEIYMDPRGKERLNSARKADDYVEGYKAGISASELETKRRLEREREMERNILQGKSIHDAVRDGDMDRVKDLLHHYPEMKDFRDESSWTPIHLAASHGNLDMLRWLVTSDADINAETSTGYNAMHIAAMNGHVNSMMLLQAMGSLITGLTSEKQSALHIAAKRGHLECVKWLVANRAHIQGTDNFGRTPLDLAQQFGHEACADFLRICLKELANPRSTFALIHGKKLSSSGGLPPIEEDTGSGTSGSSPWKDDTNIKGHEADSDSDRDDSTNKKRSAAEEKELEEKRVVYAQQQQHMEERGYSFLDSIRSEVDDP